MRSRTDLVRRSQAGVAMVTVLFVGAALTAVASAAAFVTVQQLRASSDDRRGAQSLAYAEAGIDRLMLEIKRGTLTWGDLRRAGCNPDTTDPDLDYVEFTGSFTTPASGYDVRFMVFDPTAANPADRVPPAACTPVREDPKQKHVFLVESTGFQPAATRLVRQVIEVTALGLPVGLFADTNIQCSGAVSMAHISLITRGTITNRDNCGLSGTDPYYTRRMFYGDSQPATAIPAAAHAIGQITYGAFGQPKVEHRTGFEPNCEANGSKGTAGQSLWDGSGTAVLNPITTGCASWPGSSAAADSSSGSVPSNQRPPTSVFDNAARERVAPRPALERRDYDTLREAAKTQGLYCKTSSTTGKLDCTKPGQTFPATGTLIDIGSSLIAGLPNVYVAYFDLGGSVTNITWKPGVGPCSDTRSAHKSTVLVVRNGSINFSGGETLNGAVLAPEGTVSTDGSYKVVGTIIARYITASGGGTGTNFSLSGCWVRNMPGPFLDVTPVRWSEVDR